MTTRNEVDDKELNRPISFRLPPGDRAKLMEVAAAQGLTPGQLARKIVARDLGLQARLSHVRLAVANADVLRRLLGELGRIGNNLNQIAARLNAGEAQVEAARDLARLRDALEKTLAAVIATLKRSRS